MGKFIARRLIAIPITFIIITMVLYGVIMLAPLETRINLYMPNTRTMLSPEAEERFQAQIVERYHLDEPFINQYIYWLNGILHGNWGYSPILKNGVLPEILYRTPVTLELLFYCMLLYIPLGLISGVNAAFKREKTQRHPVSRMRFRRISRSGFHFIHPAAGNPVRESRLVCTGTVECSQ